MKEHWQKVYQTKATTEVSWYELHPQKSLELISRAGLGPESQIIDVGGGASTLVDHLLDKGFRHASVLDISRQALDAAKSRLGNRAKDVTWIEADITQVKLPKARYDLWHDRALFHFLTKPEDRRTYVEALHHALKPGGHVIMAAFSLEGPPRCSGLDVVRYSPQTLARELGSGFKLEESFTEEHVTPGGNRQQFIYIRGVQ